MLTGLRAALRAGRRPHYRSVMRFREGGRTILLLAGMFVVVVVVLFAFARLDTTRRSGTAAVAIVSSEFQPGGGIERALQGTWLHYAYTVEGTTYEGYDFRTWNDAAAHRPKVCFDPTDPGDHFLVDGRVRCGIDSGP